MSIARAEHCTSAAKFQHLLRYLNLIGLDADKLAQDCQLDAEAIAAMAADEPLPSIQYSLLYERAAGKLQRQGMSLPWGAGIGTDAFRFLCYSIVGCETLGDALQRAERYERMLQPQTAYRIEIQVDGEEAVLRYSIDTEAARGFAPKGWERTESLDTVAKGSGLKVWHALMGWLIGREIELSSASIDAEDIGADYAQSLEDIFQLPVRFSAQHSELRFSSEYLSHKLVHTPASLDSFLDSAIHHLITQQQRPSSTSAAIKSLLAKNGPGSPPSFESMAEDLHMSSSSLRRRLNKEGISYQAIKDQYRCDIAIRLLKAQELKIQEIGELLGFLEASSFIRSFKSWTGITPKQFQSHLSQ